MSKQVSCLPCSPAIRAGVFGDSHPGSVRPPGDRGPVLRQETPQPKFFRLAPGREVRLRWGYFIKCEKAIKDTFGNVTEIHCTYDPATRGGDAPDGRKVKGTIHWVSAAHAVDAEVRLYETLFAKEDPNEVEEGQDFTANLNPKSLEVLTECKLEPVLANVTAGTRFQFEKR